MTRSTTRMQQISTSIYRKYKLSVLYASLTIPVGIILFFSIKLHREMIFLIIGIELSKLPLASLRQSQIHQEPATMVQSIKMEYLRPSIILPSIHLLLIFQVYSVVDI